MNHILQALAAALLAALPTLSFASTKDYASLYTDLPTRLKPVEAVYIPPRTVSVADYGAVGDGVTLCTDAFRKAVNALARQGGGRIDVPAGVWLCGPIMLKDSIELHLQQGAILYFSPDKRLFVDSDAGSKRVLPAIRASKRRNIAITGQGIIDGNGQQWRPVKRGKVSDVEWKQFQELGGVERQEGQLWYPWDARAGYPNIATTPEKQEAMRNDLLRFTNCENVLVEGVTVQNAPRFHVHPVNCRNVIIDGVTVRCPWNAQNGDAIDLSDCQQALVAGCTVDAGDDGICMKSGNSKPRAVANGCEDILIQDNTVFHAHGGFVVGSENITAMRRIVVRRCRFAGTDTGLRFKSNIGRGGKTGDIHIADIVMTDIAGAAITFQCDYQDRPAGSKATGKATPTKAGKVPEFTDIHIARVTCRGAKTAISAHGIEGMNSVHGITIANSTLTYRKQGLDIDTATADIKLDGVRLLEERAVEE